jgi:hypothetical protein
MVLRPTLFCVLFASFSKLTTKIASVQLHKSPSNLNALITPKSLIA